LDVIARRAGKRLESVCGIAYCPVCAVLTFPLFTAVYRSYHYDRDDMIMTFQWECSNVEELRTQILKLLLGQAFFTAFVKLAVIAD
jgi:hypothetical protein